MGYWFLVANIAQELYIHIVTVISNNIAQAENAQLTYRYTQFLKGLPAGALFKGFTEFQMAARRTPRRLAVGSLPLGEEDLTAPDEHHTNTHQRPVCLRTHGRSIAQSRGRTERRIPASLVVGLDRRMLDCLIPAVSVSLP